MSSTCEPDGRISCYAKIYARTHADEILAFPEGRFMRCDLPDALGEYIAEYVESNVISVVGTETDGYAKPINVYTVEDEAREIARRTADTRDAVCPCGHSGVQNHGQHYQCCFDLCDRTFSRDELEGDR